MGVPGRGVKLKIFQLFYISLKTSRETIITSNLSKSGKPKALIINLHPMQTSYIFSYFHSLSDYNWIIVYLLSIRTCEYVQL